MGEPSETGDVAYAGKVKLSVVSVPLGNTATAVLLPEGSKISNK